MNCNDSAKEILLKDSDGKVIKKLMDINQAYEQYHKFLHAMSKQYSSIPQDIEDLFQVACVGFLKAFKTYDSSKKILFMTYLATVSTNEILMYKRKVKKYQDDTSLNGFVYIDNDGNELTLEDLLEGENNVDEYIAQTITIDKVEKIKARVDNLTNNYKKVFELFFLHELKQREIERETGLSQSYVSRVIKALRRKFRSMEE